MTGSSYFKLAILTLSLSALAYKACYVLRLGIPYSSNEYKQLSWEDFKGRTKIFTGYDAAISSEIYLRHDTLENRTIAYSIQHASSSYVKKSHSNDRLLTHEQYHFNISEFFARKMNYFISSHPELDYDEYAAELLRLRNEKDDMQALYDTESDHGLILSEQRKWQFKIDSMLIAYTQDSSVVRDLLSGAQVSFPTKPSFSETLTKHNVKRFYQWNRYGMYFSLSSMQYLDLSLESIIDDFSTRYENDSIINFELDSGRYDFHLDITRYDASINETVRNVWIYDNHYLNKLYVSYKNHTTLISGYEEISDAFVHSFRIVDTDDYWINKYLNQKNSGENLYTKTKTSKRGTKQRDKGSECLVIQENNNPFLFYRGPIILDDGTVIIAFASPLHTSNELAMNAVLLGDDLYRFTPSDTIQLVHANIQKDVNNLIELKFGFSLKEETSFECPSIYMQSISINDQ